MCFQSFGRDASSRSGRDPVATLETCALTRPYGREGDCVFAAAQDVVSNFTSGEEAKPLCEAVSGVLAGRCFEGIGSVMGRFRKIGAGEACGLSRAHDERVARRRLRPRRTEHAAPLVGARSSRAAPIESAPMKIAVCVKQVPDATVHKRIDPATKRLDRSGEAALNPTDLNAVEEALRIKEAQGGEVVLVSLGPEKAVDSLRKALAMGADRAVLVSDDAAAGSDLLGTARALAGALERESADLVLFGQASGDGDGAVLWAAVADRLRRPVVSQVAALTVEADSVTGKRQTEHGYDVISAPLPAVVAVSDAINEPRYPSLKGIMGAKTKPQETLSLADVGVEPGEAGEAGSKTTVLDLGPPPSRGDQVKIEDDGSAAQKVLDLVTERKLL